MGYTCDIDGRHPDTSKVLKIFDWAEFTDVTSALAFLGVCVNYRIWSNDFAQVVSPIYHLFKKNIPFVLGKEEVEAMDLLKLALKTPQALVYSDYTKGAGDIIFAVNASLEGWKGVLIQLVKEKKHLSRYETGIYPSATKRECQGVLKALKKVKSWLYGIRFILETDASVLVT